MAADPHAPPFIDRLLRHPAVRSGYASLLVHILLGIALALWALHAPEQPRPRPLLIAFDEDRGMAEGDGPSAFVVAAPSLPSASPAKAADAAAVAAVEPTPAAALAMPDIPLAPIADEAVSRVPATKITVVATSARPAATPSPPTATPSGTGDGAAFSARRGRGRSPSALARGATAVSEQAVERGLAWLAAHQAVDGSWQFDLSGCRCDGACRDPGTIKSDTASTAIALLPFLGAGSTQVDGPYQQTVSRGLYYLLSRMQPTPRGGDFCAGTMYGHGVTTLALAEAYGMTHDALLLEPLRDAIRFIATSQDAHGGGWRYLPGQAGDITVTAWQLAALKSAAIAGVETPSPTIDGVRRFLDSVQAANGAGYGYRTPTAKPCTSAIGLLCRMYTGWDRDLEPLRRGVTALAKPGPHPAAIYQNFYLAQALVQMDHPAWPRWNAKNRDQILAQQARAGHEAGSWFFADHDTAPGGRLAHTALAVLTLEVYYRLLPIYRQEAVTTGF
jgi:hypothetical protein